MCRCWRINALASRRLWARRAWVPLAYTALPTNALRYLLPAGRQALPCG